MFPPPAPTGPEHARRIERVRQRLLQRGAPRLQMTFIVALTGLAGLGCSAALRRLGLTHMGIRYGAAVLAAYGVFLAQLWAWLGWQRRRLARTACARGGAQSLLDALDVPDLTTGAPSPRAAGGLARWAGAGGRSGGAGASSLVETPGVSGSAAAVPCPGPETETARAGGSAARKLLGGLFGELDLDGAVAVVLAVLALLSALAAAVYVVSSAPLLLADVLVDGALSAGLYRRLRRADSEHAWWQGAIRRTALPAVAVLAFFTVAGFAVHHAWPGVSTLGEAWRAVLAARRP